MSILIVCITLLLLLKKRLVPKETALTFCEYFRDVAMNIANHDYSLIGDSQDIEELWK